MKTPLRPTIAGCYNPRVARRANDVRHTRPQRLLTSSLRRLGAALLICACALPARAEPPTGPASTSPAAWAAGGAAPNAGAGSGALPYWQAPPLPSAVIQGGTIPPQWTPQPVPYQGIGPDGRPMTVYYSPTYVFTYQIGPPVLAAATAPVAAPAQVNRRQAAAQPVAVQGWNYQTQGAAPPTYALPPATVARYQPSPYQYPPGSPVLNGTPIVPPQGMPPASMAAAQPPAPWGPGQQSAPPPTQWGSSQEAPAMAPAPQQGQPASGFAVPAAIAGTAAATGVVAAQQQPAPAAATAFPPAADAGTPALSVSSQPSAPSSSAAGRSGSPRLWRVVGVNDGDTLTCLDESNQQQKVRLAEIDAPELSQDFGKVSREALATMVFGKTVEVVDDGKDRYGRWIGRLSVNGIDVNRQMVATGNAWHYAAYSHDDSLAALQTQAQAQRIGLWAQPNPQPPWEYRASAGKTPSST
jgi:endonuclease YncB( thermonuclease family)